MPKTGYKRLRRGDLKNIPAYKRFHRNDEPYMGLPLMEQTPPMVGGDVEKAKKAFAAQVEKAEGKLRTEENKCKDLGNKVAVLEAALAEKPAAAEVEVEVEVEVIPAEVKVKRIAKVRPVDEAYKVYCELEDESKTILLIPKSEAPRLRRISGEEEKETDE